MCSEHLLISHYTKQLTYILVYLSQKSHEGTTNITPIFFLIRLRVQLVISGSRVRMSYLTPESALRLLIESFKS